MYRFSLLSCLLFSFISCELLQSSKNTDPKKDPAPRTEGLEGESFKSLTLMSYNVENLFDTKHDKGKNDWTWLPLRVKNASAEIQEYCASVRSNHYRRECFELDWNSNILSKKMNNLAKVIRKANAKQSVDVLVFQEVENINVLNIFIEKNLKKMGYKYVSLLEGPDRRGIDIGVVSKFPIVDQKLHKIDITEYSERPTRGILETTLNVNGKTITIYGNHWPSQGNPDGARLNASEVLKNLAVKNNSDLIIATGDFNTLHDDKPHGININITPDFTDVEKVARKRGVKVTAKGTHWYRGEWSSLDKIFVFKKKMDKVEIDYKSFQILNYKFMLKDLEWTDFDSGMTYTDKDIPARFNKKTGEGYSDHLPLLVTFKIY